MVGDTEGHADLMSILNRPEIPGSDSREFYANVHPDERTCDHCTRRDGCWNEESNRMGLPLGFQYRSGWYEARMNSHLRGIVGQVCGNFIHRNTEFNARHVQAERRRREENGEGTDWDDKTN